jgi:hypothetical protein
MGAKLFKLLLKSAFDSFWNWLLGIPMMAIGIIGFFFPSWQPMMNYTALSGILPSNGWVILFIAGLTIWLLGFAWNVRNRLKEKEKNKILEQPVLPPVTLHQPTASADNGGQAFNITGNGNIVNNSKIIDLSGATVTDSEIKVTVTNEKDTSVSEVKIKILQEQDDIQKNYVFKQVRLISQDSPKLLSCYATADFYVLPDVGDRKAILPQSNELLWKISTNNRVNLIEGLPAGLYIARINSKKKRAELVSRNNNYIPIDRGTYLAIIRFDGDNFSPKSFRVTFYYDGKKSIEIKDISGLSNIVFAYTEGSRN